MFDHGVMRQACDKKRQELEVYFKTKPGLSVQLTIATHLHLIAETFTIMQQLRHDADYDGSLKWTRTDTLANVDSVALAFESWKTIRDDPSAQDFLITLLLKKR